MNLTNLLVLVVIAIVAYHFLFNKNTEKYHDVEFDELNSCNAQLPVNTGCGSISFADKNAITGKPYQQAYRHNMFSHFHTVNHVPTSYRPFLRN